MWAEFLAAAACAVGAIAASQSVVRSGGPAILLRLSVFGFVLGGFGAGLWWAWWAGRAWEFRIGFQIVASCVVPTANYSHPIRIVFLWDRSFLGMGFSKFGFVCVGVFHWHRHEVSDSHMEGPVHFECFVLFRFVCGVDFFPRLCSDGRSWFRSPQEEASGAHARAAQYWACTRNILIGAHYSAPNRNSNKWIVGNESLQNNSRQ